MYAGKSVLITGATGFIGANLTRALLEQGARVHVPLRSGSPTWRLAEIMDDITVHKHVDYTDAVSVDRLFADAKPEYVFHLAAYGGHYAETDALACIRTNITGTFNLLSSSVAHKIAGFVNTGSSSEYGGVDAPMREDMDPAPESMYAATKASVTMLTRTFARTDGLHAVTVRPFTVYGPWDTGTKFIPTLIRHSLHGTDINLTGGQEMHDYIFVDDLVDGYLKALSGKPGETYNLGTGHEYANADIAARVLHITGKPVPVHTGTYEAHSWDHVHWRADTSKAKRELGFAASTDIDAGLRKTAVWFTNHLTYYETG